MLTSDPERGNPWPNFGFRSHFTKDKSIATETQLKKSTNSGRRKQRWKGKKSSNNTSKETFKGDCDDLKGKVYFIASAKQADNYNNTTEAILEYFLREYTHGLDTLMAWMLLKVWKL